MDQQKQKGNKMQSAKDKFIVYGLLASVLIGLIPVGFKVAENFDHFQLSMLALGLFVAVIAGGLVLLFILNFFWSWILGPLIGLSLLGLIRAVPWIAIGFCIALGFALFHMI